MADRFNPYNIMRKSKTPLSLPRLFSCLRMLSRRRIHFSASSRSRGQCFQSIQYQYFQLQWISPMHYLLFTVKAMRRIRLIQNLINHQLEELLLVTWLQSLGPTQNIKGFPQQGYQISSAAMAYPKASEVGPFTYLLPQFANAHLTYFHPWELVE